MNAIEIVLVAGAIAISVWISDVRDKATHREMHALRQRIELLESGVTP